MRTYRVKYHLWTVEAASADEAKRKVFELLKTMGPSFITVEEAAYARQKRSLLMRFIAGP